MEELRIRLDAPEFERLISGEVLTINQNGKTIKIVLADIGWLNMINIIESKLL